MSQQVSENPRIALYNELLRIEALLMKVRDEVERVCGDCSDCRIRWNLTNSASSLREALSNLRRCIRSKP